METFLIRAFQLIFSLSILVIVHEFGHFFFSKLFKVRVEKFYLFFNPGFSLVRFKKINGQWKVKWFSKNNSSNIREKTDDLGNKEYEIIPLDELDEESWSKYPQTTEWGIGWLPLGGYVSISGMIDESMNIEQMKQPAKPWEFRSKKAWQRLLIMLGGVLVNFVMALLIYSAVLFTWGQDYFEMKNTPMQFSELGHQVGYQDGDCILSADEVPLSRYSESTLLALIEAKQVVVLRNGEEIVLHMPTNLMADILKSKKGFLGPYTPAIVDSVIPNAPSTMFLKRHDKIIAIGDSIINSFFDVRNVLKNNQSDVLQITVVRENDTLIQLVPLTQEGLIGFSPMQLVSPQTESFSFWASIPAGIGYGIDKLSYYVRQMKFIFTKEGAASIGGFGAIGSMFAPVWDWHSFWETTAFLSIILAFMNVLPIPALDGGHVLFLFYEIITGRKPSDKFMTYAQSIGMLLLFSLLFYANGMDIIRAIFE